MLWRQGDVLIASIEQLPGGGKRRKGAILVEGGYRSWGGNPRLSRSSYEKTGVSRTSRMAQQRSERPSAIAGVRGSNFFYLPIQPAASAASGADDTSYKPSSSTTPGQLLCRRVGQRPRIGELDGHSCAGPSRCAVQWQTYWAWCSPIGQGPAGHTGANHGRSGYPLLPPVDLLDA